MTDESTDAWSPERRREAGGLLASVLRRDPSRTESIARGLAPDGRGPGVRYGVYEGSLRHPARELAFQAAFTDLDAFLDVLDTGEPGALELALTIAAELDPESTLPAARRLLEHPPWKMLGRALGFALGQASSETSRARTCRPSSESMCCPCSRTSCATIASERLTIWLPADGDDPPLEGADETLLAHLRRALEWAGFPGFATVDERPEAWLATARAAME